MDELAYRLDQTVCCGKRELPFTKNWLHLAQEFKFPEEVLIKCQHNYESSPSKNMLEFQEGSDPYFTVQKFKVALKDIGRNDLVKKIEECTGLSGKVLFNVLKFSARCRLFKKLRCLFYN